MGLASKLAASQGAGGSYPPQGAYPGQQQYQPYTPQRPQGQPGQPPYPQGGAPQQGQYGGYGPPQTQSPYPQGGYAAPQAQQGGPTGNAGAYKQLLQSVIQEKNLQSMFPPNDSRLDQIAQIAGPKVNQLCSTWRVVPEVGQDIVKLALFDIILYVDDSGSMQFEENGERIQDLKLIVSRVAFAATLFDDDGITIRFMNSDINANNIKTEADVDRVIQSVQFKGLTPMGTSLRNKVLEPLVLNPARSGALRKPVLIITITDGQPAGEPQGAVFDAIRATSSELSRMPRYGPGAVSFQFAQVGNDLKAREFLAKLDNEPGFGNLVDSTSNFEVEQDEMSRAQPPVNLTPELWLLKLLLGAIDSSYDTKDEAGSRPPAGQQFGAPPQGQYGAPQGQYGASQGQYGAPPPGQYGGGPQGQYGAPPQGQYGAPPQGQYGRPPQGQYGGYGAPPQGQSPYP